MRYRRLSQIRRDAQKNDAEKRWDSDGRPRVAERRSLPDDREIDAPCRGLTRPQVLAGLTGGRTLLGFFQHFAHHGDGAFKFGDRGVDAVALFLKHPHLRLTLAEGHF